MRWGYSVRVRTRLTAAIAAVCVAGVADVAVAQTRNALLAAGVRAYDDVRYDSAAALLRRATAVSDGVAADTLSGHDRSVALTYLGAAEWFGQHRDSAAAAFQRLVAHDRHFRPDSLTFPDDVQVFFDDIRRLVHGVARVRVVGSTLTVVVLAVTPHRVAVDVAVPDGPALARLYDGPVRDSVSLSWTAKAGASGILQNGSASVMVIITARDTYGRVLNVVRYPVAIGTGAGLTPTARRRPR